MAERRMFAKSVTGSAKFLRMPMSARLLYYDLGMDADDDGIVEAFSVLRKTDATEEDLRTLEEKDFIRVLNDDFVSYIVDWNKNNQIRKDRYRKSVYHDLIVNGNQRSTSGKPNGNQRSTKYSIGYTIPANGLKANSPGMCDHDTSWMEGLKE